MRECELHISHLCARLLHYSAVPCQELSRCVLSVCLYVIYTQRHTELFKYHTHTQADRDRHCRIMQMLQSNCRCLSKMIKTTNTKWERVRARAPVYWMAHCQHATYMKAHFSLFLSVCRLVVEHKQQQQNHEWVSHHLVGNLAKFREARKNFNLLAYMLVHPCWQR